MNRIGYQVTAKSHNTQQQIQFFDLPSKCPYCHRSITPQTIWGYIPLHQKDNFSVFMNCPDAECQKSFIAFYEANTIYGWCYNEKTTQGTFESRLFSETIECISNGFIKIYQEAESAEFHQLYEICGVGYRKALEFLIKDYCILKNPDQEETIKKILLGKCINEFVPDSNIKSVAKRAVWLGNDETHYVRKWEDKDLRHLKKLINLTLHWIEAEKLTEEFESEMPD
jgi:Domain of unknown function (DUF4145)